MSGSENSFRIVRQINEDLVVNQLKQKLTLSIKGEHTAIAVKQLQVTLQWRAAVDLDLMAFYRAKDGEKGGVFSDNYPGGNLGSLVDFPFMQLSADAGVDAQNEDHQEILVIDRLDDLAEVYICTLNYTDAVEKRNSAFADYDGEVIVNDNSGHSVTVPLNATQKGQVAIIARIDHDATGNAILKNTNEVVSLSQFFRDIPGADLLSNNPPPPSPPSSHNNTSPSPTATSAPTASQIIARWVELIRLRAYDNPYIDKAAEKELLGDAIAKGLPFDVARHRLFLVCETERYALESHLEEEATQVLEECVTKKQGIDHDCYNSTVDLVQQAAYGHMKEAECRHLVKELILARQWPVRQGFLKGGNWFKDI